MYNFLLPTHNFNSTQSHSSINGKNQSTLGAKAQKCQDGYDDHDDDDQGCQGFKEQMCKVLNLRQGWFGFKDVDPFKNLHYTRQLHTIGQTIRQALELNVFQATSSTPWPSLESSCNC